jgi:hypothetical protein
VAGGHSGTGFDADLRAEFDQLGGGRRNQRDAGF